MDETNVCLSETALTTLNDGNSSDEAKNYPRVADSARTRICLIGELSNDAAVCEAAKVFGLPVVTSVNGEEYLNDGSWDTVFVLDNFDSPIFSAIRASEQRILGPTALQQYAQKNEGLPDNIRPLYCLAMSGVVVCFTGFRRKDDLNRLITLIHNMGGSVRKEMVPKVTHLIANCCGGEKYHYAYTFQVPIMSESWVYDLWEKRNDINIAARSEEEMAQHKLKPFHGAHVCFYGFPDEEKKHMIEVLQQNGGVATELEDPACTHVVVDSGETYSLLKSNMLGPRISIPPPYPLCSPAPKENSLNSMQWKNTASPAPSLELCSSFGPSFELSTVPFPSNSITVSTPVASENVYRETADTNGNTSEIYWNSVANRSLNSSPSDIKHSLEKKRTKSRRSRLSWSSAAGITSSSPLPGFSEKKKSNPEQPTEMNIINGDCKTPLKDAFRNVSAVPLSETTNDLAIGRTSWADGRMADHNSEVELRNQQSTPDRAEGHVSVNCDLEAGSVSQVFKTPGSRPSRMSLRRKSDAFCKSLSSCLKAASPQSEIPSNTPANLNQNLSHSQGIQLGTEEDRLLTTPVVDESAVQSIPEKAPLKAPIVKAEWFWVSVQNEGCADEKVYLFEEYLEAMLSPSGRQNSGTPTTPMSAVSASNRVRKRKRLREAMSKLVQNESPTVHKRRSSVSDAGFLSMSGSFLDCTTSPEKQTDEVEAGLSETPNKILSARQQVFMELVQTESNYVGILHTIMTMFKDPLEKMTESQGPLLNNTELKIIFGNLPPIYEVHQKMLEELKWAMSHWKEDFSIGKVFLKYAPDFVKAYPPFINFFETTQEMLVKCDQTKPRFHAFLKICQTKPECGRQSLQELLIRPVQRLPSISLLLNDILKHTSKSNADLAALEQALSSIREVMTHINEDKRKTEGQLVMFDIFNEIDNCPPHIVSSHRSFIVRCDVIELSESLSGRGDNLVLFLFSDIMEVCKKRSKAFNSLKSPNTIVGQQKQSNGKPYKHIRLLPLSAIKRVIDIEETDDCHNVFALSCRSNQEMKDKLYSFILADEETDKCGFLKTLCRQVANTTCETVAENLLLSLKSHQLNIDTSDVTLGTLSKAFKFASRTRLKVGRAFSFNKTPSKLKRAVSTMMSPFGSTTNLTPASQLAQMRLASCNNLNELGGPVKEEQTYVAPMSVQPTRKNKCSSLNAANLRRL